jgi:hypothetical protein
VLQCRGHDTPEAIAIRPAVDHEVRQSLLSVQDQELPPVDRHRDAAADGVEPLDEEPPVRWGGDDDGRLLPPETVPDVFGHDLCEVPVIEVGLDEVVA